MSEGGKHDKEITHRHRENIHVDFFLHTKKILRQYLGKL